MPTIKNAKIKYTSRDFASIKQDLIEHAKRYYPENYKDFSEASFGSMVMDWLAYIGDNLSFYLDYQVNESYKNTAIEYDNVIRLARHTGFKFKPNPTSYGTLTMFLEVPADNTGLSPNVNYLPVLKQGTQFSSTSGEIFTLNEDVNFGHPQNEILVSKVDSISGLPTFYAVKAYGVVISGKVERFSYTVGSFERFLKVEVPKNNVAEILEVIDADGQEYFEVEHLSQNVIYRPIQNANFETDLIPYILKPSNVPRRFTTEQEGRRTFLQFGYGSEGELNETSIADPSNVILKRYGKPYITDTSFDPNRLVQTDKFGIAPANTVLRVVVRVNTSENVNISSNSLTSVVSPVFRFKDETNPNLLLPSVKGAVIQSLEVTNEDKIVGGSFLPPIEELKIQSSDHFATQNRAVTEQDYKSLVYSMPPQYGSITRCAVVKDSRGSRRNINLFLLSQASNGTLTSTHTTIKNNLKTWLNSKRMMNDTIDILDAKIVNFGIEFEAISNRENEKNKIFIKSKAISTLKSEFSDKFEIGEPLYLTRIYNTLNKIKEISDVTKVKIFHLEGGNYSDIIFDFDSFMSLDGRYLSVPKNCVLEIKYFSKDIRGSII